MKSVGVPESRPFIVMTPSSPEAAARPRFLPGMSHGGAVKNRAEFHSFGIRMNPPRSPEGRPSTMYPVEIVLLEAGLPSTEDDEVIGKVCLDSIFARAPGGFVGLLDGGRSLRGRIPR